MSRNLTIETRSGSGIGPFLDDIARLRIEVFREFPYLYDGTPAYEKEYLQAYIQSPRSVAVLVFDGNSVVGVSTAIPLSDETDAFKRPFAEQGYNPDHIFYCGESILKKEYRGQGVYSSFFHEREQHARRSGPFQRICFCAVQRSADHPLKPAGYRPLDEIWGKFGYRKEPGLTTLYSWKDVNKDQEDEKKMVFWIKDL